MVRLHLTAEAERAGAGSIEGVLVGREAGHYRLELGRVVASESEAYPLDGGGVVYVPVGRVVFVQVVGVEPRGEYARRWLRPDVVGRVAAGVAGAALVVAAVATGVSL